MFKLFLSLVFAFMTGSVLGQTPRLVVPMGHTDRINSVAFSSDGRYVLTGSSDKTAKLWDLQGKEIQVFQGHIEDVTSVAFSPDAQYVLTGSNDGTARLWNLNGQEVRAYYGYEEAVSAVAFSPDGQYILTGCGTKSIARLWNLDGQGIQVFEGHTDDITSVAISPDGQYVLTGSADSTAKLWKRTGEEIQTFTGHTGSLTSVAFSPDNKYVLTGSEDKTAKLWNLKSHQIQTFKGHRESISSVAFSPDSKYILTGSNDGYAALWNLSEAKIQAVYGYEGQVTSVAFSPDGQYVLTGSDNKTAKLWNLKSQIIQAFQGFASPVYSVAFSPDGEYVLTSSGDHTAKLWPLNGSEIRDFHIHTSYVFSVAFSPDSKYILTGSWDQTAKLWNLKGQEICTFKGHDKGITSVAFSPNGQYILTGSWDQTAKLWNLNGQEIQTFHGHANLVSSVTFSRDGEYVLTGSWDQTAKLWNLKGQEIQTFRGDTDLITSIAFSPNNNFVLTGGSWDGTAKLWDLKGNRLQVFEDHEDQVTSVAFSPACPDDLSGGQYVLTGSADNRAKLWDLKGQGIQNFYGHTEAVSSVAFSQDRKYILTGSWDNTAKLWDIKSGEELATLITINSIDWVVTTPSGLFDASPGAMKLMYYVQGLEVIELDQLKERYYEPGLLAKIMGFDQGELRNVAAFDQVALYPEIKAAITNYQLQIQLTERSGGMGKLSLFINDKEIQEDINPNRQKSLTLDLNTFAKYYRSDTTNTLALRAYNAEGWLKSQAYELTYTPAKIRRNEKPSLYVLAVGASDYAGEQLDLRFADLDAEVLAKAFSTAGGALFTPERTSVRLLSSSAKTPADLSAKANIRQAFADIAAKAKPEDVVIVFFSGHGLAYGPAEKEQFYYLTKDIGSAKLDDPKIRQEYTVSSEELTQWLNAIPAGKQVMIVDACNAGKVVESLTALAAKDLDPSQIRALDRMKDRTGMFILTGSAADKVSYEASQYGQGLLTYSLLQGMSGLALTEDKRVDVMTLFQYSRDQVPVLAKGIGGVQTPVLAFPTGGASFDIGIARPGAISVVEAKPVFIRNNFQDENAFDDVLGLTKALSDHLQLLTIKGAQAVLIYMDVNEYESAYSMKGRYTVKGEAVEVRGRLFKGATAQGEFQVTGRKDDLAGLVAGILERVRGMIK